MAYLFSKSTQSQADKTALRKQISLEFPQDKLIPTAAFAGTQAILSPLSQHPYLLLQFHHLGLSVVQGLVSDLDVSPLVLVGGAGSSQLDFQFLFFPLCFLVYG